LLALFSVTFSIAAGVIETSPDMPDRHITESRNLDMGTETAKVELIPEPELSTTASTQNSKVITQQQDYLNSTSRLAKFLVINKEDLNLKSIGNFSKLPTIIEKDKKFSKHEISTALKMNPENFNDKKVLKNEFEGSVQNIDNDQIVWEGSGSLEVKIEVMKEDEDFLGDEKTYTMSEMEINHTSVHNNFQILIETLDSLEEQFLTNKTELKS